MNTILPARLAHALRLRPTLPARLGLLRLLRLLQELRLLPATRARLGLLGLLRLLQELRLLPATRARLGLLGLLLLSLLPATRAQSTERPHLRVQTTMGSFEIELYTDLAPRHSANFLRLASEGFYEGTLFHRVIRDFMVQAGDPNSRTATTGQLLGEGDLPYRQDPEFALPAAYHHRGALAAAREGDDENPQRRSSATQFYIVWGRSYTPETLAPLVARLEAATGRKDLISPEMAADYCRRGGTPHLDGQYTVFGQVTKGLRVIERMQREPTDSNDRPITDVRILKVERLD